jgi:hypothetical protein
MRDKKIFIKTCANCKHFKIIKQGYEVKNLLDSAYCISRCKIKGWEVKEYYLSPLTLQKEVKIEKECPYWEEYKKGLFNFLKRR